MYVMRAAQSKGIVDLLALWRPERGMFGIAPRSPWLVQCKYSIHGGGYLPGTEAAELIALADMTGGFPVFARPGKNGRGVEFIHLTTKEPLG